MFCRLHATHSIKERLNLKGGTFTKGCSLSRDQRTLIVGEIVRNGGDIYTDCFPGNLSDVANAFKVSRNTVINRWHTEHTIEPWRNGEGNNSHLTQGDLQFIETV